MFEMMRAYDLMVMLQVKSRTLSDSRTLLHSHRRPFETCGAECVQGDLVERFQLTGRLATVASFSELVRDFLIVCETC